VKQATVLGSPEPQRDSQLTAMDLRHECGNGPRVSNVASVIKSVSHS